MATNKELVESIYASFATGDVPAVLGAMAEDVQWTEADGFPLAGTYVGPQAVLEGVFMRLGEIGDDYAVMPEQFVADGDTVVVLGKYQWKNKTSGDPATVKMVHVLTLDGGKLLPSSSTSTPSGFASSADQRRPRRDSDWRTRDRPPGSRQLMRRAARRPASAGAEPAVRLAKRTAVLTGRGGGHRPGSWRRGGRPRGAQQLRPLHTGGAGRDGGSVQAYPRSTPAHAGRPGSRRGRGSRDGRAVRLNLGTWLRRTSLCGRGSVPHMCGQTGSAGLAF